MTWRPRNETDEDRRREAAILDEASASLGYGFAGWIKLSETLYEIDAAFRDGDMRICAWVEVKARSKLYDTVLLSAAKALQLYRLELATKKPAYFIINVPDTGILCHRIRPLYTYDIRVGGNNRGQNGDLEPCVFINANDFSTIAPPVDFTAQEYLNGIRA